MFVPRTQTTKENGRTRGSVTPVGSESIATAGTLSAFILSLHGWCLVKGIRTANTADMRLSAAISANAADLVNVQNGEWALISPYGDFPSPDGSYVQRFSREQAEKLVRTSNSLTGMAARLFKNLAHGLGAKSSHPVWDGHPETDKQRWPKERLLAEVTDLRATDAGLEGRITWNATGMARRTRGPLYPSPLWWHWPPSGEPAAVFPELLESIGLVPTPNISSVPAWTQNATLAGETAENQNAMNPDQLKALAKALNQPDVTDPVKLIELAQSAFQLSTANAAKVQETETALQTANAAKAGIETQLTTANSQVTTLTTERDKLKTANTALTTANETLVTGVLNIAEKRGAITPAEREEYKTKLTTANTAGVTLTELQTRKAMNTQPVEINGNRVDLSTANARASALQTAVQKRMKDDGIGYDEAFTRCSQDPSLKPLFDAMQQPAQG